MTSVLSRIKQIGPGAMVAAAFIGPGTITTATLAGASYGYSLLWAVAFSTLATVVLQEMAARLGVVGQMGVGSALRKKASSPLLKGLIVVLVLGAILIGNAAYEAGNLSGAVLGLNTFIGTSYVVNPILVLVAVIAFILLFSGKYALIERFLVGLVACMGIVFLITAILVQPNLLSIGKGLFQCKVPENALVFVIGLVGTTVVPYNLFLHAASSAKRWPNTSDLPTARWDTVLSVAFGGIITMCILIAASATFQEGQDIQNASDLAIQLQPLLGKWAGPFMAIGFFAAGLSSSITAPLAAAFATTEILNWNGDMKSSRFRMTWMLVLLSGILFSSLGYRPTAVILFAQVTNGILLPVIAIFLLWVVNDKSILGEHINSRISNGLGILVVAITLAIGLKGVLTALQIV